mgnify:CR=1 FL=1
MDRQTATPNTNVRFLSIKLRLLKCPMPQAAAKKPIRMSHKQNGPAETPQLRKVSLGKRTRAMARILNLDLD